MEIIRNAYREIQFNELRVGDVFIAVDEGKVYMKTRKAYEYPDDRDHYFNAVSLVDGSLVKCKDWQKVRIPKKVVLTIDE